MDMSVALYLRPTCYVRMLSVVVIRITATRKFPMEQFWNRPKLFWSTENCTIKSSQTTECVWHHYVLITSDIQQMHQYQTFMNTTTDEWTE